MLKIKIRRCSAGNVTSRMYPQEGIYNVQEQTHSYNLGLKFMLAKFQTKYFETKTCESFKIVCPNLGNDGRIYTVGETWYLSRIRCV